MQQKAIGSYPNSERKKPRGIYHTAGTPFISNMRKSDTKDITRTPYNLNLNLPLSPEYVTAAMQHGPLRDRILNLDQQYQNKFSFGSRPSEFEFCDDVGEQSNPSLNRSATILDKNTSNIKDETLQAELTALREEKIANQHRRELAEAEKDYFLGQNKELRNVLEKKNKEASEFVELITNLNGIVLHLKTQSSNLKADLSNSESNARSLATELENVRVELEECRKSQSEAEKVSAGLSEKNNLLEEANKTLKENVESTQKKILDLDSELKTKGDSLVKVLQQLQDSTQQLMEKETKLTAQQFELDRLSSLVRLTSSNKERLETALADAQMSVDRLTLECSSLSSRLDVDLNMEEKQEALHESRERAVMLSEDLWNCLINCEYRLQSQQMEDGVRMKVVDEINELKSHLEEMTADRKMLQSELEFCRGESRQLKEELANCTLKYEESLLQIRESEGHLENLQNKLSSEAMGRENLLNELMTLKTESAALKKSLLGREEQIAELQSQFNSTSHSAHNRNTLNSSRVILQGLLDIVDEALSTETDDLIRGADTIVHTNDEDSLKVHLSDIRQYVSELLRKYNSFQQSSCQESERDAQPAGMGSSINVPQKFQSFTLQTVNISPGNEDLELWELREQVDKTDQTLKDVSHELAKAEDEKLQLEASVSLLSAQLRDSQLLIDWKNKEIDRISFQQEKWQQKIDADSEVIDQLTSQVNSSLMLVDVKCMEIEALAEELSRCQSNLGGKANEAERLSELLRKKEILLNDKNSEIQSFSNRLKDCETILEAKNQEMESIRTDFFALRTSNEGLLRDLRLLQMEIISERDEHTSKYNELNALSIVSTQVVDNLTRELENSKKQVSQCQTDIAAAVGLSNDLTAKLQKQSKQLRTAHEENKRLVDQVLFLEEGMISTRESHTMEKEDLSVTQIGRASQMELQKGVDDLVIDSLSSNVVNTCIADAIASICNSRIDNARRDCANLEKEKLNLLASLHQAEGKFVQERIRSKQLEERASVLSTGLQQLKLKTVVITSSKEKLFEEIVNVKNTFESLLQNLQENVLSAAMQHARTLHTSNDAEISRLSRSERALAEMLKQKEQQLLKMKQTHETLLQAQAEESAREISTLQLRISDHVASSTNDELSKAVESAEKQVADLRQEKLEMQSIIQKLTLDGLSEESSAQLMGLNRQIALLKGEIETAKIEKEKFISEKRKLELDLHASRDEVHRLSDVLLQIKVEADAETTDLKDKLSSLQAELKRLSADLQEKNDHLDQLAVQYGQAIEELAALRLKVDSSSQSPGKRKSIIFGTASTTPPLAQNVEQNIVANQGAEVVVSSEAAPDAVQSVLNWFR